MVTNEEGEDTGTHARQGDTRNGFRPFPIEEPHFLLLSVIGAACCDLGPSAACLCSEMS